MVTLRSFGQTGRKRIALGLLTGLIAGMGISGAATSSWAGPAPKNPWVGKTAPTFQLPDMNGKVVDLAQVAGKRPVVLVFYRGIW